MASKDAYTSQYDVNTRQLEKTASLSAPGAASLDGTAFRVCAWGQGIFRIFTAGVQDTYFDASSLQELGKVINRLFPQPSTIPSIITKIRAMQDTAATQCNPAGPERARFDALTDVIVMLEELEEQSK